MNEILPGFRRVLVAHGHPDDETLSAGALLAALADSGRKVAVLTATRGEGGQIVPGSLPGDLGADDLARARAAELRAALDELGVIAHFWLGAPPARAAGCPPRRYLDSGMRWVAPGRAGPAADASPDSLCAAPVGEVAADVGALLTAWRPDLVVTCDPGGGYGHPDHRRIWAAVRQATARAAVTCAELLPPGAVAPGGRIVDVSLGPSRPRMVAALRRYRSQLTVAGDHVVHVGGQRQDIVADVRLRLIPPE